MSNENAQESAFPLVYDGNSAAPFCHNGLTKREYIATMAMKGMVSNPSIMEAVTSSQLVNGTAAERIAKVSIDYAYELLKQLES